MGLSFEKLGGKGEIEHCLLKMIFRESSVVQETVIGPFHVAGAV